MLKLMIVLAILIAVFPLQKGQAENASAQSKIISPEALLGASPLSQHHQQSGMNAPLPLQNANSVQNPPSQENTLESSYRLDAGDKLKLTVFGEDELSDIYLVNEEGYISVPLIGGVRVKARTISEVRHDIMNLLADGYLINPSVALEMAEFRPVYILGEVRLPGSYDYVAGMSIRNAVAISGGFTYRANQKSFTVQREDESENKKKYDLGPDDNVMPGDIITVRERFF